MAAAHRSMSSVAAGTRTNTTFTAPSGIQNGDALVIVIYAGADPAVTVTAPSGFATATGFSVDMTFPPDTWTTRIYAFWKVAASESGNYTCTHSSAGSEGWMVAYSGTHATTPINPAPQITDHAPGTGGATVTAPTITPGVNDSAVMYAGFSWDAWGAATPPTGTTPTFTERHNPTTGGLYFADGVLATAGATGAKSVTCAQGDGRPWVGFLMTIESDGSGALSGTAPLPSGGIAELALEMWNQTGVF